MQKKNKDEEDEPSSYIYPETRRVLRIADILLMDADEYEPRKLTMARCTTPPRILSRWFSALKRRRTTKIHARSDKGGGNQIARDTRCSTNGLYSECHNGERCGVDSGSSSFNLGVACGLLCVIAAGKNELSKMVELRTQMELILHNAKQELGSKQVEPNNNDIKFTSFSTNFQQQASTSASGSQFSLQSVAVRRDESSDFVGNQGEGDEYVAGMGELEAELHAELERLQLQLDSEDSFSIPRSPQQQRLEEIGYIGSNRGGVGDSASTDYSDEMLWGCGVAPLELERKLHQVLETRQEERIKELEDALECAEQKLQEKEIEVSWWRDTARLMSGHESELPYSRN
ncbi:protein POLAR LOCALIZATION DURING ASYMMETRIC DIVISION AND REDISTRIBUTION [Argentina anserina]|uniref:protein POLAR LOCALIZATION DURING ASYMMETRIC DIVISION AND REDISTRIBUTION n=1 Tax=Argentina anserina TaxID=57926 RepID=UPI0021766204|nr:protein POLAR LOCALIZATION DURING ASYMMETRIC DIVISION AND REDISTRIBUTION [Potentilla anserina]